MVGTLRIRVWVWCLSLALSFVLPRPAQAVTCMTSAQCNDGDLCTTDACTAGTCTHSQILGCCLDVSQCNDNNACTTDSCNLATHTCTNSTIANCCTSDSQCNDGLVCTSDVCNLSTDTCVHATIANCCITQSDCNDGNACTTDACSTTNQCTHTAIASCCTTATDCNDGNVCTSDTCSNNTCAHAAVANCCTSDSQCGDGNLCTSDVCDLSTNQCTHPAIANCCTSSLQCADSSACTTDACDLATNLCTHTTIAGCCASAADCSDGNPCTLDACNTTNGNCTNTTIAGCCLSAADCNDSNVCTSDACTANACVHAAIAGCCSSDADCNDNNACTGDTCDTAAHTCMHTSVPCCTADVDCADADDCTLDRCDTTTKTCSHLRRLGCCTAQSQCIDSSSCTVDECVLAGTTGTCSHVGIGGCCHDAADCNDGNACTTDACDPSTGICTVTPQTNCCASVADCDDANPCTSDTCTAGTCSHTPTGTCATDAGVMDAAGIPDGPTPSDGPPPASDASPSTAQAAPAGCTCDSRGAPDHTGFVLAAVVAVIVMRRRRRAALLVATTALIAACSSTPEVPQAPDYDAIQRIFAHDCAGSTCHIDADVLGGGLDLSPTASYASLINVASTEDPRVRVKPNDPGASYLYCKLDPMCAMGQGAYMTVDGAGRAISTETSEAVRRWIEAGASPAPPHVDAGVDAGDQSPPSFGGLIAAAPVATDERSVVLTWQAAHDDVTPASNIKYAAYSATTAGGENFVVPAATVIGATTLTISGLVPGQTYYFVVRATDAAGNHDTNNVERATTTLDLSPPTFGGAQTATAAGPGTVTIGWLAASDNADLPSQLRYRIYVGLAPMGENMATPAYVTAPGSTSASISGLGSSATYYVIVRAVDTSGNEDTNKVERSATTVDTIAPQFGGVTSATPGPNSVTLAWSPAVDNTTPASQIVYLVYQASASGAEMFATPTFVTQPGATSYAIGGLAKSTTYFFVVRARDLAGNTDANTFQLSALTPSTVDTTAPTFAGVTSATGTSASQITLGWSAATDAVTASSNIVYLVYQAATCATLDLTTPTYTTLAGATSFVVGGLTPATSYCFAVRARDQAGNVDANAATKLGMTVSDTQAPTFTGISSATGTSTSTIGLGWTAATDNVTASSQIVYLIYAATAPGGETFATPTYTTAAGATSYNAAGLAATTMYYFVVRARDAAGNVDANTVERSAKTTGDTTAPVFAGATSAMQVSSSQLAVSWAAATDDVTPQSQLVYDAYVATSSGAESFATPTATSAAGATTVTITGLVPSTTYYIVVRARDQAGNRDTNLVQVSAMTAPDLVAPTFAGLATVGATTNACSLALGWSAATDDVSPASAITYLVYRTTSTGGETFATPTATTSAGATSFTAGGLAPGTKYFFVTRARDQAGNIDTNTVEKSATTPTPTVSLSGQVQPIFTTNCAKSGCHTGGTPASGLNLSSGLAFANLVNITSAECTSTKRVAPCDASNSYLIWKLNGSGACFSGSPMPKTGSLSASDIATITSWVNQGAPNN